MAPEEEEATIEVSDAQDVDDFSIVNPALFKAPEATPELPEASPVAFLVPTPLIPFIDTPCLP